MNRGKEIRKRWSVGSTGEVGSGEGRLQLVIHFSARGQGSSISFYITIISESFLIFSREASITPSHLLLIIFVCYS